jgi:hypothetical protein
MLARQSEWFVRIVNIAGGGEMCTWMERISIDVWTGKKNEKKICYK